MKKEGRIKGDKIPESPPDVLPFARLYWEAYTTLSSRREYDSNGFPKYICYGELLAYCELADYFSRSSRRMLMSIVESLDKVFMPEMVKKITDEQAVARRKAERAARERGGRGR